MKRFLESELKVEALGGNCSIVLNHERFDGEFSTTGFWTVSGWKPDLILAAVMCIALVLVVAKIFKIPMLSFTLQSSRPSRTVRPLFVPKNTPRFLWRHAWQLIVVMFARQSDKPLGRRFKRNFWCFFFFFSIEPIVPPSQWLHPHSLYSLQRLMLVICGLCR